MAKTAIVDLTTGRVKPDASEVDGVRVVVVPVSRNPDPLRDVYDAGAGVFRAASLQEQQAIAAERELASARAEANSAPFLKFFLSALCVEVAPATGKKADQLEADITAAALAQMLQDRTYSAPER